MPKNKAFGFVADPLDRFDREAESTLFLMREIARHGHSLFVCEPKDLFLKQGEVYSVVKQIVLTTHKHRFYRILRQAPLALSALDCLFLRKDPPFDLAYLHHLYLLSKLEKKVLMINAPSAILKHNEKLSALQFPFAPKTWVGSRFDLFQEWAGEFVNGVVLKPLHSSGGSGVHWLKKSKLQKPKSKKIFRKLTQNEIRPILAQEFLPAVSKGDKRIILWNGKCLGAFIRKPTRRGEFRANLHLGGRFEATVLTANDRRILKKVGPWSQREGLYFVGLDVIGSRLSEINVTSPMGLRELNVLYGLRTEEKIVRDILNFEV